MCSASALQHARGGCARGLVVPAADRKTAKTDRTRAGVQRRVLLGRQAAGLSYSVGEAQSCSRQDFTYRIVNHDYTGNYKPKATAVTEMRTADRY